MLSPSTHAAVREAVDDWLDAVELHVEDCDAWSLDNLIETTRYLFDDTPREWLLVVLTT